MRRGAREERDEEGLPLVRTPSPGSLSSATRAAKKPSLCVIFDSLRVRLVGRVRIPLRQKLQPREEKIGC